MAAPAVPSNLLVQQGNGQVYLSWDLTAGADTYKVYRSTNNITFTLLTTVSINNYLDTAVTVNTQYWYKISALTGVDESSLTGAQTTIPTYSGNDSLLAIRTQAKQRADRVNSNFLTTEEWNNNINQSYFELYDLLKNCYEDWFFAKAYQFVTNGSSNMYPVPDGSSTFLDVDGNVCKPFYNLLGVDCGLGPNSSNAWVTLHKYDFIERNRYVYPNITSTYMGVFNMRYRLMGNTINLIPTPSANQYIQVWYVPRMTRLLRDIDVADGVSGWTEYIIVDAAIKALQKEESDVTALMMQKQALIKRIEETAINRDIGQPDTISNTRSFASRNGGGYGTGGSDGGWAGF